jgi:hypothetical protein
MSTYNTQKQGVVGATQYARVNATADGDNTIVAAPGVGQRILALGYSLRFVGAGPFVVKSGAAGSVHLEETGVAAPGARVSYSGGDGYSGAFLCDVNAALVVNNFATGDTLGHVTYRIVQA